MEVNESVLAWTKLGLIRTLTSLLGFPALTLSNHWQGVCNSLRIPPCSSSCCLYSVCKFCRLGIHCFLEDCEWKHVFLWSMSISVLSNHPSWTLQIPPSPQAGSPTAPCTRRIYSCFLQFLTTISLALIFLSKYDFSNGTVLSSYCQNIKTIYMFM